MWSQEVHWHIGEVEERKVEESKVVIKLESCDMRATAYQNNH